VLRTRLGEQTIYEFSYEVIVQSRDINYGGHLGNDALVALLGEARVNLLRELNASEMDLGDGTTAIIMGDLVVNYRGEVFLFERLRFESHVGEVTRVGFRLFHRVTRNGTIVALAEAGIVAYDYRAKRVTNLPPVFLRAVEARCKKVEVRR
jgi:acyl-CoA thioesterase FadM